MKTHHVTFALTLFVCAFILNYKTPQLEQGRVPASEAQAAMAEFAASAGN